MTEYSIEVQPDFLQRQANAQPVAALAQLIWNGLDADATTIRVDFEDDKLGGMAKIIVTDDGHGIPHAEAPTLFRYLGGSWKARCADEDPKSDAARPRRAGPVQGLRPRQRR